MFKKYRRNKKLRKIVEKLEVGLAIVQGRIDYYEADLRLNWDDPDIAMSSAMELAWFYNKKMEIVNLLLQIQKLLKK